MSQKKDAREQLKAMAETWVVGQLVEIAGLHRIAEAVREKWDPDLRSRPIHPLGVIQLTSEDYQEIETIMREEISCADIYTFLRYKLEGVYDG